VFVEEFSVLSQGIFSPLIVDECMYIVAWSASFCGAVILLVGGLPRKRGGSP